MRIALVSQEYPPETAKGGIGTQTYLKAEGLAARGHEVHVISRTPRDAPRQEEQRGGVRVTRIPGFSKQMKIYEPAVDWLTYSVAVAAELAALHGRAPVNVVDFPEWGCEGYVHLLNRSEWYRVPAVIHLHGPLVMLARTIDWPEIDSEFYRIGVAMEGTCVRLADAVFSSSACSADWCAQHHSVPRERITVLHTGVDTRLFSPQGFRMDSRPTVVFVGKIVRNKGVELLLEAACRLSSEYPDLRLLLVGRAEEGMGEQLQERARACGFPHLLELAGFVDRQHLPAHLASAHVFAAPSQYEGGPGFVYLEAMACGLPVIGCSGSGAAEVVVPDENGLLIPPGDVNALVAALRRLLSNAAEREAMGARARCYVLREADSEVCLRRLEAFYTAAAAGKSCSERAS